MSKLTENDYKILFLVRIGELNNQPFEIKEGLDNLIQNCVYVFQIPEDAAKNSLDKLKRLGLIFEDRDVLVSYTSVFHKTNFNTSLINKNELKEIADEFKYKIIHQVSDKYEENIIIRATFFGIHESYPKYRKLFEKGLVLHNEIVYTGKYPYAYFLPSNKLCDLRLELSNEFIVPRIQKLIEDQNLPRIYETIKNAIALEFELEFRVDDVVDYLIEEVDLPEDIRIKLMVFKRNRYIQEIGGDPGKVNEYFFDFLSRDKPRIETLSGIKWKLLLDEGVIQKTNDDFFEIDQERLREFLKDVFPEVLEKYVHVRNQIPLTVKNYKQYLPEEWIPKLEDSANFAIKGDFETAMLKLGILFDNLYTEMGFKEGKPLKLNHLIKKSKRELLPQFKLESEKNTISLNMDKYKSFFKEMNISLTSRSKALRDIRHITAHGHFLRTFDAEEYMMALFSFLSICKMLKTFGWDWYFHPTE